MTIPFGVLQQLIGNAVPVGSPVARQVALRAAAQQPDATAVAGPAAAAANMNAQRDVLSQRQNLKNWEDAGMPTGTPLATLEAAVKKAAQARAAYMRALPPSMRAAQLGQPGILRNIASGDPGAFGVDQTGVMEPSNVETDASFLAPQLMGARSWSSR